EEPGGTDDQTVSGDGADFQRVAAEVPQILEAARSGPEEGVAVAVDGVELPGDLAGVVDDMRIDGHGQRTRDRHQAARRRPEESLDRAVQRREVADGLAYVVGADGDAVDVGDQAEARGRGPGKGGLLAGGHAGHAAGADDGAVPTETAGVDV